MKELAFSSLEILYWLLAADSSSSLEPIRKRANLRIFREGVQFAFQRCAAQEPSHERCAPVQLYNEAVMS